MSADQHTESRPLIRGIGLGTATALNMIDMIGVGPFITMPLVVAAMGGPQALLGWIVGALLAICDGLVWAELGAAMPGSGGSYVYLREIYGPQRLGKLGWIIFAGLTHFDSARAFSFPPGAFSLNKNFVLGLGSAMLIATYDYWGAYNVCFLGGELKEPGKTIPRAVLLSILLVAGLYLLMNLSVLGVVDWREMAAAAQSNNKLYVFSIFMHRIYG